MIRFSIFLFSLLFYRTIEAQTIPSMVTNASGEVFSNSSYSLEWSLGELAVSTLTGSENILTQGFLQHYITIVDTEDLFDESHFAAFPNPVHNWMIMQTDIPDIKTIQIYSLSGNLVLQNDFRPLLDLNGLNSGTFVVSLLNNQNQLIHSFKIIKI